MWNADITQKKKAETPFVMRRNFLMTAGIASIVLSFVVLGMSAYEGFFSGGKMRMVELPGFHELELEDAGLYAGLYQHRGSGPLPIKELTSMDVRVMSKDDYEEVPVLMNSTGQQFSQFGFRGLPLFNFAVRKAGSYTLSGVYTNGVTGPTVNVMLFPQTAQNVKQTLIVGASFFVFFFTIGLVILLKLDHWAPKKN